MAVGVATPVAFFALPLPSGEFAPVQVAFVPVLGAGVNRRGVGVVWPGQRRVNRRTHVDRRVYVNRWAYVDGRVHVERRTHVGGRANKDRSVGVHPWSYVAGGLCHKALLEHEHQNHRQRKKS